MTIESTIILRSLGDQSTDLSPRTASGQFKGAGYYRLHDGMHTAQIDIDEFAGFIKFEGTLVMYPGESDWVELQYIADQAIIIPNSTPRTASLVRNFVGNWVWIRVVYSITNGSISLIRYNI